MDDAILAYAQNGEPLRPEQGYPLRLLVPGFEGNMNVKWLCRLELGDQPWWTQSEVAEYADPMAGGKDPRVFFRDARKVGDHGAFGRDAARRGRVL